jgi:hypothetical protein
VTPHHQPERGRLIAVGRRSDSGTRSTLLVTNESTARGCLTARVHRGMTLSSRRVQVDPGARPVNSEDQSDRFVITGQDPDGRPRTIILWREVDLVNGVVVRRVVVTLDATINTATTLTFAQAVEVAEAILAAAR